MEENKPFVTETEYPDSDTDIINGDGTPIIDTSDQKVDTTQEEKDTSESDAEENTEDSSTTDTEENGVEEDTTTEIVTDPANDPATLESALLVSTYAALNKLAEYVPTEYVNNSEPDLDAEHLNNTEQGLLRVTNLLNGAVDVINDLQTTVAQQASAIETLNSKTAIHLIDRSALITAATTEKFYTGFSIAIPANSYFSITAYGTFSNSPCKWIGLSLRNTGSLDSCYYNANAGYYHACVSLSAYTGNEAKIVYIWGQWDAPSDNNVLVSGFYITQAST